VLRPELLLVAQALCSAEAEVIALDDIAEAIGTLAVSSDEIEALFAWLEAQGRVIEQPTGPGAAAALGEVLTVARQLRRELGRSPSPSEIAERGSLSIDVVQRALWFARVLQR